MGYEHARVGVDAVIFTIKDSRLHVILNVREKEPFLGRYELPGGLLLHNETAEEALQRKLDEVLGSRHVYFQQFNTFTDPKRDPRERTVSIGFIALVHEDKFPLWFDCGKLPQLAFDHREIIEKARLFLKRNVNELIAKQFLPALFPLNKLQEVYECIEGQTYDNRNFRKKMIAADIVEETKKIEKDVSHRPAKLYRFKRV